MDSNRLSVGLKLNGDDRKIADHILNQATNHAALLDWLRFAAALIVLLCHARGMLFTDFGGLEPSSKNKLVAAVFALTRIGAEAVIVFFVLSGYFVAGVGAQRLLAGSFSLRKYIVDRATRIFMPYLPALALTWICDLVIGGNPRVIEFLGNAVGLQGTMVQCFAGNASLWSLAYEIWFYVLFGFVAYVFCTREESRSSFIFFSGACVCAAIFSLLDATFLFCWLLGGAAFFFRENNYQIRKYITIFFAISIGTLAIELQSPSKSIEASWIISFLPSPPIGQLLLACGIALLIPILSSWSSRFHESGYFARLGKFLASFSFSLYLIHYPILKVIAGYVGKSNEVSFNSVGTFLTVIVIALSSAWIFYLAFEKHTNNLRRKISIWTAC